MICNRNWFIKCYVYELRRGPDRAYLRSEENLRYLRGRLLLPQHFRRNAIQKDRFFVAHDVLEEDTPLGRLLKAAVRLLLGTVRDRSTLHVLGVLVEEMSFVSDVDIGGARTIRVPNFGAGPYTFYQLVQTPDHVAFISEAFHDARIIPLDGRPHLPDGVRQWNGDSRGHWAGDTLVVETRNFSLNSYFRGAAEGLHHGRICLAALSPHTRESTNYRDDHVEVVEQPAHRRLQVRDVPAPRFVRSRGDELLRLVAGRRRAGLLAVLELILLAKDAVDRRLRRHVLATTFGMVAFSDLVPVPVPVPDSQTL